MRRLYLAYPALLAVIPVLYQQVQNPWPAVGDTVAFSAAVAAAAVLGQGVAYGVLRAARVRPAASADWAALLTACGVGLFFYWPTVSDAAHASAGVHPQLARLLALLTLVGLGAAVWWSARRDGAARLTRALPSVSRFLAFFAVLLTGWFGVRIAAAPVRLASIVRHSTALHDLARPVPVTHPAVAGPPRDVYVLLLDAYPSADVLRGNYGIDNTPFLDSLRALGFRVPASIRSNYPATILSVPSFLDFAQLEPLTRELPAGYKDYSLGGYLLTHNRTARFLKDRGYRTVFFPSVWYPLTRHDPEADVELPPPAGFDFGRTVWRSLVVSSFASGTVMRRALRYLPTQQEVVMAELERSFAGLNALAARPAGGPPVYAFAHLLIPHPTFLADSACRPHPRGTELRTDNHVESPAVRAAVGGFVACANRLVLRTAHALLSRPGPRPIIILQGDHGTAGLGLFETRLDSVTPAQVHERFSPFGAYYLPDGGAAAMSDTVTLVNVLPTVFRYYYGADLPQTPNSMYFVDFGVSYHLTPIDTLSLRPVLSASDRRALAGRGVPHGQAP